MAHVYVDSAAVGGGTGANWANAYTTVGAALAAAGTVAGDNIWVAHTHAETTAAAVTWTDPKGTLADPIKIICVNKAGSVPPVSADLRTTATVSTTGASTLTLCSTASRAMYVYGITFTAGSGAVVASLVLSAAGSATVHQVFEACAFRLGGTSSTTISTGAATSYLVCRNCTFQFASVTHSIAILPAVIWDGGSITGSNVPTNVFGLSGATTLPRIFRNFDFSLASTGKTLFPLAANRVSIVLENCKIDPLATLVSRGTVVGGNVTLIRTDSAETSYRTAVMGDYAGDLTTSITVVRTGGASDGVTPVSWKLETTANAEWTIPLAALPIWKFNDTADAEINVTIEGVADPRAFSALPTNKEFWIDLAYQGTAGSSLGLTASGTADVISAGTALTASTEAWDSAATARANTTAYALGDVIKVASNPGRIFICTTSGTSAASEPAGYASAVDGGSVTDGAATFKAGWRFKQTIAVTPVLVGAVQAMPRMAKASSVIYLDPKLAVLAPLAFLMTEGGDFLTDGITRLIAG